MSGADGDLVTAFGAATRKNSGSAVSLHPNAKAVGLGTVAAIGLKCALWHGKTLLKFNEWRSRKSGKALCEQELSIPRQQAGHNLGVCLLSLE